MEIKITKRQNIFEQHNDKVSNYCYLVYGKIINDEKTKYKKFRFVVHFDGYDLYEEGCKTKADTMNYLDMLIDGFISSIVSYDNCKAFYEACNESIRSYNDKFAA